MAHARPSCRLSLKYDQTTPEPISKKEQYFGAGGERGNHGDEFQEKAID